MDQTNNRFYRTPAPATSWWRRFRAWLGKPVRIDPVLEDIGLDSALDMVRTLADHIEQTETMLLRLGMLSQRSTVPTQARHLAGRIRREVQGRID